MTVEIHEPTPQQRRNAKRTAIALALFVAFIFAAFVLVQASK